ncbi:MAG: hydroxymethylbilane synthase [Alphaproteobacteria bacterium]|nr:hydroxymethylbilane synthase [Alphaproteobacteria bacterium]
MSTSDQVLRIGTRGSPLALAQAEEVRARLAGQHPQLGAPGALEVVTIRTTGDRVQDRTLAEIGGKGLFAKEIQQALRRHEIDLAVHSLKDMETWQPDDLEIAAVLPRVDPRDVFVSLTAAKFAELPAGAVVGTASLRRQAQVLSMRPDLRVVPLRGNVGTRLAKLERGEVDATLLALAGLRRLGQEEVATEILEPETMLPAACQGVIAIEVRAGDAETTAVVAALEDPQTRVQVTAERAALAALDGTCHTPIGAHARPGPDRALTLDVLVADPNGSALWRAQRTGPARDAAAMGASAGRELRQQASPAVFAALKQP